MHRILLTALFVLALVPAATAVAPLLEPFGTAPWRDCNQDGFRGLGQLELNPYRAELLFDRTICPVQAGPPFPGQPVYNDGRWVREQP